MGYCHQQKGRTFVRPFSLNLQARNSSQGLYKHIHKQEQAKPDDVNKMPIPGYGLKPKMVIWLEMAFHGAEHDYREHDGAKGYMKTVKSGQHEESGPEHSRSQLEVELTVGVNVLKNLKAQEGESKRYRQE